MIGRLLVSNVGCGHVSTDQCIFSSAGATLDTACRKPNFPLLDRHFVIARAVSLTPRERPRLDIALGVGSVRAEGGRSDRCW